MKKLIIIKSLLIFVALAATTTYALMNKGSFSEKTPLEYDTGNVKNNLDGYWDNSSLSSLLSDTFWFGTGEALTTSIEFPANISSPKGGPLFPSVNEAGQSSFMIDEKSNTTAELINNQPSESTDALRGSINSVSGTANSASDRASSEALSRLARVSAGITAGGVIGKYAGYAGGRSAGVVEGAPSDAEPEPSLNADQLEETLEWYGVGNSSTSTPTNPAPELVAIVDDKTDNPNEWVEVDLEEAGEKSVSVPAPSPLILLLVGTLALIWKRRWVQTASAF